MSKKEAKEVEATEVVETSDKSDARKALEQVIAQYENSPKYEAKKAELEAKLNNL